MLPRHFVRGSLTGYRPGVRLCRLLGVYSFSWSLIAKVLTHMVIKELVGFVYNASVREAEGLIHSLVKRLDLGQKSWIVPTVQLDTVDDLLPSTSLIITAGGDGTILRTVRSAAPFAVPILGINLGRVGFMTELTVEEAVHSIPTYLSGDVHVEERMMLQASIGPGPGEKPTFVSHGLNDAVVTRGDLPKLIDIDVIIDAIPLTTYRADGLIIATATGSTGYALSAGGPILYPGASVFVLQPLAAHMNLQTGLILSDRSIVELGTIGSVGAILSVDGRPEVTLGPGDKVMVERSPHKARFLRASPPSAFYSDLAHRLGLKSHPAPA